MTCLAGPSGQEDGGNNGYGGGAGGQGPSNDRKGGRHGGRGRGRRQGGGARFDKYPQGPPPDVSSAKSAATIDSAAAQIPPGASDITREIVQYAEAHGLPTDQVLFIIYFFS